MTIDKKVDRRFSLHLMLIGFITDNNIGMIMEEPYMEVQTKILLLTAEMCFNE